MATITTKETRAFNWANPGTLKVDEDGDASLWWERSPDGNSSDHFCGVNSGGSASASGADSSRGVCFGFYI